MRPRPLLIFYLLVIYVFASFTWWSFLLLQKNKIAFDERIKLEVIRYNRSNNLPETSEEYLQTKASNQIKKQYERQKWMIVSEGAVFLLLLAAGSIRLWQTFRKEINLARQQNNFLLSITHELKSPLASMKLSLQTLLRRMTFEDKYKKLVTNSVDDIDRLSALVDNILYAARMEDTSFSLHNEQIDVSETTHEIIQKLASAYKDTITIRADLEEDITLITDKMAWSSVIQNLIENAVKYSPDQSIVEVSLRKDNGTIIFEVKDSGIGISASERDNIFKKFYRIGNEETRNTKGTGLGLFIVKKIVDLHKGKIVVSDNKPRGTVFKLSFPENS